MPVISAPTLEQVRSRFPALASGFAFMDNAGGSQVPLCVADAVRDYMLTSYVQVDASYAASRRATEVVAEAHEVVSTMFGGTSGGTVILGASTSALCRMLSDCYAEVLSPGDEVIVAESGHEANVFPWVALAKRGVTVIMWEADPDTGASHVETLERLLTSRTRIVAFPQVSNILGAIENVAEVVRLSHAAGARVVMDSVAYAPHSALDVATWGVDFCVFSCYKVFGPHIGALWGSHEALAEITGRNHPFIPREYLPVKFELGGVQHEACAGMLALCDYFAFLSGRDAFDRASLVEAFVNAARFERPLTARLLEFLTSKPRVRIIGPATSGPERVATVSFLHRELRPAEIVSEVDKHQIGMRHGNFYSWRLMERLGILPTEGVARVSLAHYNSPEEVDRLISVLDPLL